MHGVAADSYCE